MNDWIENRLHKVPRQVKDGVWVEVVRRDASICRSDDFDHADLWKDRGDRKDIMKWRIMK